MNEAIKKWRQEPQEGKTVQKSDILEYLAFSYYSQVRKIIHESIIVIIT